MSLTLTTNPVSGTEQIFSGFNPVEYVFKREDLAITSVTSGTGGAKITVGTDLTSYLSIGDTVYFYSEGTNYTYDESALITAITSTEITTDADYIETGTGGYMNYLKNYYVELQCVDPDNDDINILPFSLTSDGDAAGNITIDVSIANDLNEQTYNVSKRHMSEAVVEFEVKYREVHLNTTPSFTLVDNKLNVLVYSTETPSTDTILNSFDSPKIYMGYPSGIVVAKTEDATSSLAELLFEERNINNYNSGSGTLGTQAADVNGFLMWLWDDSITIQSNTKYIVFNMNVSTLADFLAGDFDTPDFVTT